MSVSEYIKAKVELDEVIQKLRKPLNKNDRFNLECMQMQLEMRLSLILDPYLR